MPFAGYKNFAACVSANSDKANPEAYCAVIMRSVEGPRPKIAKHSSPIHPGTGTDQSAHGGGGGKKVKLYHLTDDPKFAPNPDIDPPENALSIYGDDTRKGIYLTATPEYWVNRYNYVRPFIAEFEVDESKLTLASTPGGSQRFLPAEDFGAAEMTRLIPTNEFVREEYGEPGWVEGHFSDEWDTPKFGPTGYQPPFPDYRYEGPDVRDMDPAETQRLIDETKRYLIEARGFTEEDFEKIAQPGPAAVHINGNLTIDRRRKKRRKKKKVLKHAGPIHPGTGSTQEVHGGGGRSVRWRSGRVTSIEDVTSGEGYTAMDRTTFSLWQSRRSWQAIRSYLTGEESFVEDLPAEKQTQFTIHRLDRAIGRRRTSEDIYLYRGRAFDDGDGDFNTTVTPQVGDVFSNPSYTATTFDARQALSYANDRAGFFEQEQALVFRIQVPKGTPVGLPRVAGSEGAFDEAILPRDAKFKVTRVQERNWDGARHTFVEMDLVTKFQVRKHAGPIHPGTGTSQEVHGGRHGMERLPGVDWQAYGVEHPERPDRPFWSDWSPVMTEEEADDYFARHGLDVVMYGAHATSDPAGVLFEGFDIAEAGETLGNGWGKGLYMVHEGADDYWSSARRYAEEAGLGPSLRIAAGFENPLEVHAEDPSEETFRAMAAGAGEVGVELHWQGPGMIPLDHYKIVTEWAELPWDPSWDDNWKDYPGLSQILQDAGYDGLIINAPRAYPVEFLIGPSDMETMDLPEDTDLSTYYNPDWEDTRWIDSENLFPAPATGGSQVVIFDPQHAVIVGKTEFTRFEPEEANLEAIIEEKTGDD